MTKLRHYEFLLLFSFFGFLDTAYLAIVHYKNIIPPCSIAKGCEKVLTSSYSAVFGIPTALLGALYFAVLIILSVLLLQNYKKQVAKVLFGFVVAGFLFIMFLLYTQIFLIKAFCQYCLLADPIIILLLILSFLLTKKTS